MGHGMGHRRGGACDGVQEGQGAAGLGHGMAQRWQAMQEGQDRGGGMQAGGDTGGLGCRGDGTQDGTQWDGQDGMQPGWDTGRTGCGQVGQGQDALPTLPAPCLGQGGDGTRGPGAVVGTRWEPGLVAAVPEVPARLRASPCPVPQLQERYPDLPMELHLWARRQPLLSCRPDALRGTLFGSAEAFVVLPNATRVPAFLLDIVSGCCGTGTGAEGLSWGWRGPCWAMLGSSE